MSIWGRVECKKVNIYECSYTIITKFYYAMVTGSCDGAMIVVVHWLLVLNFVYDM